MNSFNAPTDNLNTLYDYIGENHSYYGHFLLRFCASIQKQLEIIAKLEQQQQWQTIAEQSHKVKSAALAIGAYSLCAICESLSRLNAHEDLTEMVITCKKMELCFNEFQARVQSRLSKESSAKK